MADHDKTHKRFFTHRRLVRDFFAGYLPGEWTERMDFATLEPVEASRVGQDLSERHGDGIWRVRWDPPEAGEPGSWFYFYLLVEFQSKPDPLMAVRLNSYVSRLLEELVRQPRLARPGRLPPVVPLVLYDGTRPWRAPLDLSELFVPVPESVRQHLPRLRPLFLDESRLPASSPENLARIFFALNTSRAPEELPDLVTALRAQLPPGEESELRRDFARLVLRTLRQTFPGVTIPEAATLEEIPMFGQRLIDWRDRVLGEARAEGLARGQKAGEIAGQRAMLLRLLEKRFGLLPERVRRQVQAIRSPRKLEALAERVLVAESLEEMGLAS